MADASADESSDDCYLLALSHDELGVIVDGLADPLQPVVAVALSSTSDLSDATHLVWGNIYLTTGDLATLGMLLRSRGLPKLLKLAIQFREFGDAGLHALCNGLGRSAAPSLRILYLAGNKLGHAGAETLASALNRGAMPMLEDLNLFKNPIGIRGAAVLAAPLRKHSALRFLRLNQCGLGDEGVASLFAGVAGKDDFKALVALEIEDNALTERGCATLASALESGAMPEVLVLTLTQIDTTPAQRAMDDTLRRCRYEPRVEAILRYEDCGQDYGRHEAIIQQRLESGAGLTNQCLIHQKRIIKQAVENVVAKIGGFAALE